MKKYYQNDIIVNPASQISYFSLRQIWLVRGLSNARTTIFATIFIIICLNDKSWAVKLWIDHFCSTIHDLPHEQVMIKVVILTYFWNFGFGYNII